MSRSRRARRRGARCRSRADPFDREPERVGEVVDIDVPLASREHSRHPDPLSNDIGRRDPAGGGQRVGRSDEQLVSVVSSRRCLDPRGHPRRGEPAARNEASMVPACKAAMAASTLSSFSSPDATTPLSPSRNWR